MEGLRKMTILKASAVLLSLVMISVCFLTGCSKNVLFKCSPDNIAGLKRIEFSDGVFTLFFDKKKVSESDLKLLFDTEDRVQAGYGWGEVIYEGVGKDDVKIDRDKKTVSIVTGVVRVDEGVTITLRCDYKEMEISVGEAKLKVSTIISEGDVGPLQGEISTTFMFYTQTYDKRSDSWSELEYDSENITIWQ